MMSRERRDQIFKDALDEKYQTYLEKIKDQVHSSTGVTGALTTVKNYSNSNNLAVVDFKLKSNMRCNPITGQLEAINETRSNAISTPLRTPALGSVKFDKLN